MEKNLILQALNNYNNGAFFNLEYKGNADTTTMGKIDKVVKMVVRKGIDYDAQKRVKMARENGELPKDNQGLKWGVWSNIIGEEGLVIYHKDNTYIRFYPTTNVHTTYIVNGVEVDKVGLEKMGIALKPKKSNSELMCMTINAENILKVGK